MSVRRALALAACGLAGGSVLLSAVVVGKQPARSGGDSEPRPAGSAVPPAAPPGLLLLPPTASCPPTAGWIERPASTGSFWDSNWDRREPLALINLKKKNEETGEEELASRLDHCKAKATRHIFLIRHSQYNLDGRADKDRTLTPLGREQAELTGRRLASLGLKFDQIIHSSMTRATETTEIISKHLPGGYGWKRRWHGCSNGTPRNSATETLTFGSDKACYKCLAMKKVSLFNGKLECNTLLVYCLGVHVNTVQ